MTTILDIIPFGQKIDNLLPLPEIQAKADIKGAEYEEKALFFQP
jgi:hypothetical protein